MADFKDFNEADPQQSRELIPHGSIVPVHLTVRPGAAGEDGWLKRSKDGSSLGLDCQLDLIEGDYAKRKFWWLGTTSGPARVTKRLARSPPRKSAR